jgi:hypothetical protein
MSQRNSITLAIGLLSALAAVVHAEPWAAVLTDFDRGRIDRLEATRAKALERADFADAATVKVIKDVVGAQALPIDRKALPGNWRCRSLKLGGELGPASVNSFFTCRIRMMTGNALVFEKITGSIRRSAKLAEIDSHRMLYYGAYFAERDKPQSYGAGKPYDEIGMLTQIARNRLRIELPEPYAYAEALHEVIELAK